MVIGEFNDCYPPELDGVGTVVKNYAQELSAMGDECYYVAPNDPGYTGDLPFRTLLYHGIKMRGEPYHVGIPLMDPHYTYKEIHIRFDIVHAHSPFTAGIEALRIAKLRRIPIVATFHSKYYDDFYDKTHSELLAAFGKDMVVNFYNHCDEVWAVNEKTADVLRRYGYRRDIVVMPNGTDIPEPDPEGVRAAREEFAPDGVPLFIFVGQMNWKKNIRRTLEAVALYRRTHPCRLLMVGQGPDENAIRALAGELNLDGTAVFTGHISERRRMMNLLAASDMMIFPSLYDNAPMVVREAAAAGTPAILLRGSCAAENIEDGVNGLLCEDTAESICACIGRGLPMKDKLGEGARRSIPIPWRPIIEQARMRYVNLIRQKKKEDER